MRGFLAFFFVFITGALAVQSHTAKRGDGLLSIKSSPLTMPGKKILSEPEEIFRGRKPYKTSAHRRNGLAIPWWYPASVVLPGSCGMPCGGCIPGLPGIFSCGGCGQWIPGCGGCCSGGGFSSPMWIQGSGSGSGDDSKEEEDSDDCPGRRGEEKDSPTEDLAQIKTANNGTQNGKVAGEG